ncbi:MAG: hypothetical protein FJ308_22710, partial [Planctomycetes bacterium]|nr:hypothetical protein [Planctomycetota bacterium]
MLPRSPQNDQSGKLVASGSMSQYNLEGGQSACTAICVVAAVRILSAEGESVFDQVSSPLSLDAWVREGVRLYRELAGADPSRSSQQHASVDDIFEAGAFRDICQGVMRGVPFQGTVDKRQSLIDAFQAGIDFGVDRSRLAITLTKSGETVLCVADCTSGDYRWFLFDSHGQSHEKEKVSYCKEYSSFHRLLDAYLAKYPFQDFGSDSSIQSSMYNLFEAIPIVLDSTGPQKRMIDNIPVPMSLERTMDTSRPARRSHSSAMANSFSVDRGSLRHEAHNSDFWSTNASFTSELTEQGPHSKKNPSSGKLPLGQRGLSLSYGYEATESFATDSPMQMHEAKNASSRWWPWPEAEQGGWKRALLPRSPQNDQSGKLVASGSMSQY